MGKSSKQPDEVTTTTDPWSGIVPYLTGGTHYGNQALGQQLGTIGGQPGAFQGSVGGYGQYPGFGGIGGFPGGFGFSGGTGGGPVGVLSEAANLYRQGPGFSAPFNPLQTQSQNQALNYANNFDSSYQPYQQAITGALSGGLNPYLDDAIASAVRPINQAYDERIQPGIRSSATGTGNVGSSRTGIMEGIAERGRSDAIGDVSSGMSFDAWNQSQDQQARAMALAPQMFQVGQTPYQITGQVGDLQYQQAMQEQLDPYNKFDDYYNSIAGVSGLGGSQKQTTPRYGGNPLVGAIGGAAGGAGLANLLGGGGTAFTGSVGGGGTIMGTAAANPWMWPLLIGGGLLGAFS